MRIERVELFPLCYPFAGPWKFFDAAVAGVQS